MALVLLIVHSWFRWFAVAGVLVAFVNALRSAAIEAPWQRVDVILSKSAAHLMNVQVVLGVAVYATSPMIRGLLGNMQNTMRDPDARFFAVEHAGVMLLAVGAVHMGAALAKKADTDQGKHTRIAVFFAVALVLMAYGIPWTRPLLRMGA